MNNDNHYQVLFCDRTIKIVYSVADARKLVKSNEYATKVKSITRFYLDKNSNQKSNPIKF
jgi:negative regulator of replication initiation